MVGLTALPSTDSGWIVLIQLEVIFLPYREDVDDPRLLLLGVAAPLYHHPQLAIVLGNLHLDQVRLASD